jgi:hypothetical protein
MGGAGTSKAKENMRMHTLHFILLNADSAAEAAQEADSLILHWGDENNWRSVGGVASEDGSDDIENHDDGGWCLSYLDGENGVSSDSTYFSRAVALLRLKITGPVTLPVTPHSTHPDLKSAIGELSDRLRAFDPQSGDTHDLWCVRHNLKYLSEVIHSRRRQDQGEPIPEFFHWQLDHFGLTDMTEESDGARRYLVFLDMHS